MKLIVSIFLSFLHTQQKYYSRVFSKFSGILWALSVTKYLTTYERYLIKENKNVEMIHIKAVRFN